MSKLVVDGCQCQRCVKAENARLRKTAEMVGRMEDFLHRMDVHIADPNLMVRKFTELQIEAGEILADIQKAKEGQEKK